VESVKPYIDRAANEDKVFSLCQHDWSSIREDPEMRATEAFIRYAQGQGVRILTYHDYYDECRQRHPGPQLASGAAKFSPTTACIR
jgi:hypothetical protein